MTRFKNLHITRLAHMGITLSRAEWEQLYEAVENGIDFEHALKLIVQARQGGDVQVAFAVSRNRNLWNACVKNAVR